MGLKGNKKHHLTCLSPNMIPLISNYWWLMIIFQEGIVTITFYVRKNLWGLVYRETLYVWGNWYTWPHFRSLLTLAEPQNREFLWMYKQNYSIITLHISNNLFFSKCQCWTFSFEIMCIRWAYLTPNMTPLIPIHWWSRIAFKTVLLPSHHMSAIT